MTEQSRSNVIKTYPLGNGLDVFGASFHRICDENNLLPSPNAVERFSREGNLITSNRGRNTPLTTKIDLQNCVLILLSALQTHPAARHLRSRSGKTLFTELSRLNMLVTSDDFDFDCITPLIRSTHDDTLDDAVNWGHVLRAVTEPTPPPRPVPSSIQQTPLSQNTSGLVNSSEFRQGVDLVLKAELEPLYAGIPHSTKRSSATCHTSTQSRRTFSAGVPKATIHCSGLVGMGGRQMPKRATCWLGSAT